MPARHPENLSHRGNFISESITSLFQQCFLFITACLKSIVVFEIA